MSYPEWSGVYCIHCLVNDKKYIGGTTNLRSRMHGHKRRSKSDTNDLYEDIRQYGMENFVVEMVEEIADIDLISTREDDYILHYDTINNGYNTNLGQRLPSLEKRRKTGNLLKGRVRSDQTRKKMSKAQVGRRHSDETKKKMSEASVNRTFTEETRRKISEYHKGKIVSDETRMRMSKAQVGRKHSDETKKKISEAHKRRHSNQ